VIWRSEKGRNNWWLAIQYGQDCVPQWKNTYHDLYTLTILIIKILSNYWSTSIHFVVANSSVHTGQPFINRLLPLSFLRTTEDMTVIAFPRCKTLVQHPPLCHALSAHTHTHTHAHIHTLTELHSQNATTWSWATVWQCLKSAAYHIRKKFQYWGYFQFPLYKNKFYGIYMGYNFRQWRMTSSGMWRHVDLVWTDVSEEHIISILRVEKSVRFTQDLHSTTSQKMAFFIVTAVKTSNPTILHKFQI
jgi:hypothetical protein